MRKWYAALYVVTLLCASARAQDTFKKPQRSGYFFVAPGGISANVKVFSEPSVQFGGGFEGFIYRGFGFGIDGGALRVASDQPKHWAADVCLDAIYNFQRSSSQKLSPFVMGGITLASAFDVCCGYNFGGGIQYWLGKHYGLRIEFRDHARVGALHTYHDPQARIGISVR